MATFQAVRRLLPVRQRLSRNDGGTCASSWLRAARPYRSPAHPPTHALVSASTQPVPGLRQRIVAMRYHPSGAVEIFSSSTTSKDPPKTSASPPPTLRRRDYPARPKYHGSASHRRRTHAPCCLPCPAPPSLHSQRVRAEHACALRLRAAARGAPGA